MTDHPITPPPELVLQWYTEADNQLGPYHDYIATQAARWGSDQELEACCQWLEENWGPFDLPEALYPARRPKQPSSLKEQALAALRHILNHSSTELGADTIRRALEALDD